MVLLAARDQEVLKTATSRAGHATVDNEKAVDERLRLNEELDP